jgi:hypothetical protein
MAKDIKEQSNQLNLTVVALVALVAIVGLVALVLYTANVATGGMLVNAQSLPEGSAVNAAGQGVLDGGIPGGCPTKNLWCGSGGCRCAAVYKP